MSRETNRFYLLGFLVLLHCVGGALGCRSTEGGALRAGEIEKKVTTAKAVLENPNATPAERKAAAELLDEVAKDSRALGRDVDKEKKRADDNADAASKWRWAIGLGLSAGVAFFFFRRRG